jgi:hypothetical protein
MNMMIRYLVWKLLYARYGKEGHYEILYNQTSEISRWHRPGHVRNL